MYKPGVVVGGGNVVGNVVGAPRNKQVIYMLNCWSIYY